MRPFAFLRKSLLIFLLSLFVFVGRAEAIDGMRGDECIIEEDEVINEDFYFLCQSLEVKGMINGDLIGLASRVKITADGRVMGDIWMVGGQLVVEGVVEDDLHFMGADLQVQSLARFPDPRTDIVAIGLSMELDDDVVVPGDVAYYGYQAILNGKINGNVDFQGQALVINGTVAGNTAALVGDIEGNAPLRTLPFYSVDFVDPGLQLGEDGYITGDLDYQAPQRVSVGNQVGGEVLFTQAVRQANITDAEEQETFLQILGNYILKTAKDVTALSLVGILILNFFSSLLMEPSYRVQTRFVSAFSWGLILTLLSIPTGLLLLLASLALLLIVAIVTLNELTVVLGILLAVINLGFLGVFFFLLVFLGRVVTCFVVGYGLVLWAQQLWTKYVGTPPRQLGELWMAVIVGVTVISLIVNLPLGSDIGTLQFLLTGLVAFAGLGATFMYFRDLYYVADRRFVLAGRRSPSGRAVPPPPEDIDIQHDVALGMENLPPGFQWFEETET